MSNSHLLFVLLQSFYVVLICDPLTGLSHNTHGERHHHTLTDASKLAINTKLHVSRCMCVCVCVGGCLRIICKCDMTDDSVLPVCVCVYTLFALPSKWTAAINNNH